MRCYTGNANHDRYKTAETNWQILQALHIGTKYMAIESGEFVCAFTICSVVET